MNDNAPQTTEPVYYPTVMENSPKDVSIIQIEAFDPDTRSSDKLSYRITSGNPQGFFAINPKTGKDDRIKCWILCRIGWLSVVEKHLSGLSKPPDHYSLYLAEILAKDTPPDFIAYYSNALVELLAKTRPKDSPKGCLFEAVQAFGSCRL